MAAKTNTTLLPYFDSLLDNKVIRLIGNCLMSFLLWLRTCAQNNPIPYKLIRRILCFSFFIFHFSFLHAQAWKLAWSDEFNGDSINRQNWVFDTGTSEEGWGNNELEYYSSRTKNARVRHGKLEITARRENYNGSNFTSARLKTLGLQSWTYGRVEARIKLPSKQGLWPAFWMLGQNIDTIGFPYCGEIDIMEYVNLEHTLHGTMHWSSNNQLADYGGAMEVNNPKGYHVYAIEWDSLSIVWLVDGKPYWVGPIQQNINNTGAFHHPFFILLNLAVGGEWPGNPSDDKKEFPAIMYVDYVRVYKK